MKKKDVVGGDKYQAVCYIQQPKVNQLKKEKKEWRCNY